MLQVDDTHWQREIERAEEMCARRLVNVRRHQQMYLDAEAHGAVQQTLDTDGVLTDNVADGIEHTDNYAQDLVMTMLPTMAAQVPHINTKSLVGGKRHRVLAIQAKHLLNNWANQSDLVDTLQLCAADMPLSMAAAVVYPKRQPRPFIGPDGTKYDWSIPTVERISPLRLVMDPAATSPNDARWIGYVWVKTKRQLQREATADLAADADAGWDVDTIGTLDDDHRSSRIERLRAVEAMDLQRGEVMGYDIWVREATDDAVLGVVENIGDIADPSTPERIDAHETEVQNVEDDPFLNGIHLTFAVQGGGDGGSQPKLVQIREPRAAFTERRGSIVVVGAYPVADEPLPLSPADAAASHGRLTNTIGTAMRRMMSNYNRAIFLRKEAFEAVQSGTKDGFYQVQDLTEPAGSVFEWGGVTPQMIEQYQIAREGLYRRTSIDDQQAGIANQDATATAVAEASSRQSRRMSFPLRRWEQFVVGIFERAWFYMQHNDEFLAYLGSDAEVALKDLIRVPEGEPIVYQGGGEDNDFESRQVHISVEPGSMEQTVDFIQQQKALQTVSLTANVVQIMQLPWVRADVLARKLGNKINDNSFESVFDMERLSQIKQAQLQAMQAQIQAAAQPQGGA